MSRLFVTARELNFISDINKELSKDVIGQKIYYYPISEINTRTNPLYNESPEKIFDNPIEIEALVESPENQVKTHIFGPERINKLNVFIQFRDLVDRSINITIGDFIQYGKYTFEITQVIQLNPIYGMVEQLDGIKLECVQSRLGQFNPKKVGPSSIEFTDQDAVQTEFVQQRGQDIVDDKPTGDKRELQQKGVLDAPLTGVKKVNNVEVKKSGSSFYDE
jgi:hypothetical protein